MIKFVRKWNGLIVAIGIASAIGLLIFKNEMLAGKNITIQYINVAIYIFVNIVQDVDFVAAAFWEFQQKISLKRIVIRFLLAYFSVIWSFAAIYQQMSLVDEHAFNIILGLRNALYFSVTTISTVGFGDIYPVSYAAKSLVCIEIFSSVFFNLTMFAYLSSFLVQKALDRT